MEKVETAAKWAKGLIVACGAYLADKLGILYPILSILLIAMIIDYISGMMASKREAVEDPTKGWNSKKGVIGICKKVAYAMAIACAIIVDYLIFSCAGHIGIEMPTNTFFGLLVSVWFILNELLSILENVGRIGVELPGFLTNTIAVLKNKVEVKGDDIADRKESEE